MAGKNSPFRIGVLDQSPIAEGSTAGEALQNSLELAQLADELGYSRYWLAEHHGTPALACASPEVLIGPIAAATKRIRVGSGGIMLPHYSPLKVAESFSMLSSMFPGRVDLGVGRAAGTSPAIAFALQRDRRQRAPDDFLQQFEELLGYFGDEETPGYQLPHRARTLRGFAPPQFYLLGSSLQSAIWAAQLGLPYVFADFINSAGAAIVDHYRQSFRASAWLNRPYVMLASWTVCAETTEQAMRLAASTRMLMALLQRGQLIPVPSVAKAERFLVQDSLAGEAAPVNRRIIAGAPAHVHAALEALAAEYGGVDEVLLVNILYDHSARLRSYQLVADAFNLESPATRQAIAV